MAITDEQMEELRDYAFNMGKDRVLNDPTDQQIIDAVFDYAQLHNMRTKDEFNSVITEDDMPAPEDRCDLIAEWTRGVTPETMMVFDAREWEQAGYDQPGGNARFWRLAKILSTSGRLHKNAAGKLEVEVIATIEFQHDKRKSEGHFINAMKQPKSKKSAA